MLCPKDFKPCCDDLCHGGGCLAMAGAAMYEKCAGCGNYVSDDDHDNCTCDYEEYGVYDDDEERKPQQAGGRKW